MAVSESRVTPALLARRNINLSGNMLITLVVGATVIGGLIISGFFLP